LQEPGEMNQDLASSGVVGLMHTEMSNIICDFERGASQWSRNIDSR